MATVEHTISFLKAHHHNAFPTADGLVAITEVVMPDNVVRYQDDQDDNWFEELQVFPIVGGMVDLAAVKAWLGY